MLPIRGRQRVRRRIADLIAANDVTTPQASFATNTNLVTLLSADGTIEELPLLSKYEVACRILDRVTKLLAARAEI